MGRLVKLIGVIAILYCYQIDKVKAIDDIYDYIKDEGYPVEKHAVETSDGYRLDLYRIPGAGSGRTLHKRRGASAKKTVLLMHGMLGSADEFVAGGRGRGLAFNLADRNFDVFLGNSRGSKYGREHTSLNANDDPSFWNYCWDDIGKVDLPAIIDKIVAVSNRPKMDFIGYNQGNTAYFVMLSSKPDYNHRIDKMIALGPMVFMEHAHHPMMSIIKSRLGTKWIDRNLGESEFAPSDDLKNQVMGDCSSMQVDYQVCNNFYFLTNGYSRNLDQEIVPQVFVNSPYPASVMEILHYAQLLNTKNFVSYQTDPNVPEPPYNLTAVTSETHLLYVPKDYFCNQRDVAKLSEHLSNSRYYPFSRYQSNVDLLFAKDVYEEVQLKIFNILH